MHASALVNTVLTLVAKEFADRARTDRIEESTELLTAIDRSMRVLLRIPANNPRLHALVSGTGLRRNLFPSAASFSAVESQK